MPQYKFRTTGEFIKKYKKLTRMNQKTEEKIDLAIKKLLIDPFYSGLNTHKVNTRKYGLKYSSRISGDLRIIWDFYNSGLEILALSIGGHSGSNKVHK